MLKSRRKTERKIRQIKLKKERTKKNAYMMQTIYLDYEYDMLDEEYNAICSLNWLLECCRCDLCLKYGCEACVVISMANVPKTDEERCQEITKNAKLHDVVMKDNPKKYTSLVAYYRKRLHV